MRVKYRLKLFVFEKQIQNTSGGGISLLTLYKLH